MKRRPAPSRAGFSLIEMIGVLAIMAILASIIVPNALKSLDRAAVRAEASSLDALGDQVKLYLKQVGSPPTEANWTTQLAGYADLNPTDLATNKRNMARVFLLDSASTPAPRAMILSSMRTGLAVPTSASTSAAQFAQIWNTADGNVPSTANWPAAWGAVANAADYLVIERINLTPIYATDLQSYVVTLNNTSGATTTTTTTTNSGNGNNGNGNGNNGNGNGNGNNGNGNSSTTTTTTTTIPPVTASFSIQFVNGTVQGPTPIAAGATATISPGMRAGDRVHLFNDAGGATLGYTYVVKDAGMTFDFNGTQWLPR